VQGEGKTGNVSPEASVVEGGKRKKEFWELDASKTGRGGRLCRKEGGRGGLVNLGVICRQ